MARPALLALGAIVLVAGGAALGYGVTRKPVGGLTREQSDAMGAAVNALDSDVKAARSSVKERASTLAGLLLVQSAVETDVTTATDMLEGGELAFKPQPGEVVELGQIKNGEQPQTLLIQPVGAMHSPHAGTAGSFAELMGDKVIITEVANVTPPKRAGELTGYIMVTRPLELKPAIDRIAAAGIAGTIDLGAEKRSIGSPAANAQLQTVSLLPSVPDLKLVVAVPPKVGGMPMPIVAGGGIAAGIGLILLIAGVLAKGASASAGTSQAQVTAIGAAQTQLSTPGSATNPGPVSGVGVTAAGTPSPYDPSGSLVTSDLAPGAMVGRWEIIKRLGSGGMADVYLARAKGDAGFEKTVAVKVMHPHLARNQRAVEHFLDEARLAARITHPNVVAIQDLGKIGNDYVIVMEYVDGVDLDRLLQAARAAQRLVPVDVALGILCRICDGLNAAYKALATDGTPLNIVHRDVKSANVLVSKQGGVKVVDFGIAKAAQQTHNTVAGETKGTPSMMAPEQRVGEQVDVRADVYSAAAVAYEILTGQAVNLDLAALAHLGVENWPHLPLPSSLRPQLPAELDGILLGAMAFERDKRPADCAVFEAAFERVMKQYALTASDKDIARWVASELALLPVHSHDLTAQG